MRLSSCPRPLLNPMCTSSSRGKTRVAVRVKENYAVASGTPARQSPLHHQGGN